MDLSIIIVNYNTRELTLHALESIYASQTEFSYEVILVDNLSSDGSVASIRELHPRVRIIQNDENVGFAKANNQGIALSKGRYVLLLNSDTYVNGDTIQVMATFMEDNPGIGASTCKVVLPDGRLDPACKRGFPTPLAAFFYLSGLSKIFPKSPIFNRYHLGHLDPNEVNLVDAIVGAFMLVRRDVIDAVGLLDESFFMYGEDIDWCFRIREAGWPIYFYPRTQIVHYKGGSSSSRSTRLIREFYRAMLLFYEKHYRTVYHPVIGKIIHIGINFLMFVALGSHLFRQKS